MDAHWAGNPADPATLSSTPTDAPNTERLTAAPRRAAQEVGAAPAPAAQPSRAASRLRKLLPVIGIALLVWVLSRLDSAAFTAALARTSAATLALSAALFSGNVWIKVLRWQRLLRAQAIALPHRVALAAYLSSQFYAQVTVGRVGEFLRIEALLERDVSPGTALASCVFDRLLDVMCVLSTGVCASVLYLGRPRLALVAAAVMLTLAVSAAGLLRLFGRSDAGVLTMPAARSGLGARAARFIHELAAGMRPMLRPRALLEASAYTLLAWCCYFAALFVLGDKLGIAVSRVLLTATAALAALSSLLPVTISGLGARELIYIEMLRAQGVPNETAVALSLSHLAVMTASAIALGLAGIVWRARQQKRV
jgi:uncharacterized protein (TIRG00374 family)